MNVCESPRKKGSGLPPSPAPPVPHAQPWEPCYNVLLTRLRPHLPPIHHPRSWSCVEGMAFIASTSSWKHNVCVQLLGMIKRTKRCLHPLSVLTSHQGEQYRPKKPKHPKDPRRQQAVQQWGGRTVPAPRHTHTHMVPTYENTWRAPS